MSDHNFVIEGAKKYKLANDNLIELYGKLSLLFYDNQEKHNFIVAGSGIGGGNIDFSIVVPIPNKLPEFISDIIFNKIDLSLNIKVEESDLYKSNKENHYIIEIG